MPASPLIPPHLSGYWQDAFGLESHLQRFLGLDPEPLRDLLQAGCQTLAELGRRDFDWDAATEFYREQVGTAYLMDLSAWHLSSRDYIGDTLRLIADQAKGRVLDFGGGIGTHALGAAYCSEVTEVVYWDLNPLHRQFVSYRAQQLGLQTKVTCPESLPFPPDPGSPFDTLICLDVLEHLPDPISQLRQFKQLLTPTGTLIVNWYFFKGFNQEFPFHLEDPAVVNRFLATLQQEFLEVFHPYLMTTRCYQPWDPSKA